MATVKSKQMKLVAATVGAGAAVTMGVLGITFAQSPGTAATVSEQPEPTLGETSTVSVAPTKLTTTFVTPSVTAEPPEGFGP